MYTSKQFNGWVQQHECRALWIDDQVERTLLSAFIRVVDQSVAESKIQIEATLECRSTMVTDPSLKGQQQVFGRVSSALLPVFHGRDIGLHQDLGQRDYLLVVRRETLFSRNLFQDGQYNFTWRSDQLVGGSESARGARRVA